MKTHNRGATMDNDTNSRRDATDLEIEQQKRIKQLEKALQILYDVACECDGWSSFPIDALEQAEEAL